jgi:hypothetical protein
MIRLDARAAGLFNAREESFFGERSKAQMDRSSPLKFVKTDTRRTSFLL